MKNKLSLLLLVSILFLSAVTASAAAVEVKEAVRDDLIIREEITGTIRPYQEIMIPAQISGTADEVNVEIGAQVAEGELLLSINTDRLIIQKKQAEAGLESARANYQELINGATEEALQRSEASYEQAESALDNAKTNLELVQKIYNDKTSLKQQLLNAEQQLRSSEQQLKIAEENLRQAEVNFEQAERAYQRSKDLYEDQVISEQEFEDAESRYKNAQSSLNNAESSLNQAEASLSTAEENYRLTKNTYDNPTELKQQLENARSQVANAESNLRVAEANLTETRKGAREERIRASRAQVQQAEAGLEEINLNLAYAEIESPIDGVIYQVNVDEGEMINTGQSIVNVMNLSELFVEVEVTAGTVSRIKQGDKAAVKAEIISQSISGEITNISPSVNPQSKNYLVKVKIANPEGVLKAGMFADVEFETRRSENTVIIPIEAVVNLNTDNPTAYIVEDGKAVRRDLELGLSSDERVEILSGINEGENVIIRGQNRLEDGAEVEVIN